MYLFFGLLLLIVGRESVLGVGHEAHCGRRLVSGLFTRPRLPLGYSYITTVPRGACRLNVSEIVSSDNYIALKIGNGSYIMNGEFAVSAPGTYEAAGARFLYTRHAGQDVVFAHGPILHPIDIMVLYTQPGPSIKYEFFTKSLPGEIDDNSNSLPEDSTTKHIRRHHDRHLNFESLTKDLNKNRIEDTAPRKFMWKILSYSQCSRSCGGGIQVGKYRCVETSPGGDREVSTAHCTESPPTTRRRRCGNLQCPPRWRTAAWSPCPQCGPATRTRIVGCVQDHNKGITKISDVKCPAPKPPTTEACNIPSCGTDVRTAGRTRDQTDNFRDGPVYTVALNSTGIDVGPEYSLSVGGWQYTDWSECVGWCVGGGVQSRSVRCADPAGCERRTCPVAARNCTPTMKCEPHEGHWFTGEWSPCTSTCHGKQVRGVLCIGDTGRHLRDAACRSPRPEHERSCGGECTPTWYTSDWGQCTGNCSSGTGLQRRSVVCARAEDAHEPRCTGQRPPDQRPCSLVCAEPTIPPDLTIESQKIATEITTTHRSISAEEHNAGCEDKLPNCALAVQARLCHYKYYIYNCCESCNIL